MKAWKVTMTAFPDTVIIYQAGTRNQAKSRTVFQAKDAGYSLEYINIKAVRATEWDSFGDLVGQGCLGWYDGQGSWGCLEDVAPYLDRVEVQ